MPNYIHSGESLAPPLTKLLTVNQFCSRYAVSRSEAYRQRRAGHLPFVKIGKASRIAIDDAEAWLAALRDGEAVNE